MDITKIRDNRAARESRQSRPISAFMDLFNATHNALEEVTSAGLSQETQIAILKSHLINTVTAVEVYYRDMLDSIFKLCEPDSFNDKLKKLHDRNYKIDDLVGLYVHQVHPLELIADNLSFQNIDSIERVYSHIIGTRFWKEIRNVKWRLKESPENEYEASHDDIAALKSVFELRHQLIHNPSSNFLVSRETISDNLNSVLAVVMASDLVISQHITSNLDPELATNRDVSVQVKPTWTH